MNKKGQLGMGGTWFPVFFALIVLVIIYIVICGILALFRSPGQLNISSLNNEDSVLLMGIDIEGKRALVFEGLYLMKGLSREGNSMDKKIYDLIQKAITEFVRLRREDGKDYCVLADSPSGYFFVKGGDKGTRIDPGKEIQIPLYEKQEDFYEIRTTIDGNTKAIRYYQGECAVLGEKK